MKQLFAILFSLPLLAFGAERTVMFNSDTLKITPTLLLQSNILSGTNIGVSDGGNGKIFIRALQGIGENSIVAQGTNNQAYGKYAVVGGGSNNVTYGLETFIGGGKNLLIQSNKHSTIAGGHDIQIRGQSDADDGHCFVGGGENIWTTNAGWGVIAGGRSNVLFKVLYGAIGGGWENWITNSTFSISNSTIAGGWRNIIRVSGSLISGGYLNNIIGDLEDNGHVISGGADNKIDLSAAGSQDYHTIGGGSFNWIYGPNVNQGSYIGGGFLNLVSAGYSGIMGGNGNVITNTTGDDTIAIVWGQLNHAGGSFSLIGSGYGNTNLGLAAVILHGQENWITANGNFGVILGGGSNKVDAAAAWVLGNFVTNSTDSTIDMGFSQGTKTRINDKGLITLGASANAASAITLTGDNQVVNTTTNSYIRLQSDNATAANRSFVLTQGTFTGQWLTIEWLGTNAGELVDDSAQNGAGNHRLSATWTPTQYDTLFLVFNGTDWIERGRSAN